MSDPASPKAHRTASRVTGILEAVAAQDGGLTLAALTGLLDAPKSSVHGLVSGLEATGYLRRENGAYVLGPAVASLLLSSGPSLAEASRPLLEEIRDRFDETVMLATLVGDSIVFVEAAESSQLIRYSPPLGERRPLYPTSPGKCFLAHMTERRRDTYLKAHVEAKRRARVVAELQQVLRQAFAVNHGETLPDINGVSSPVLVQERVFGCITVAGPAHRMAERLDDIAHAAREAAGEVAGRLYST